MVKRINKRTDPDFRTDRIISPDRSLTLRQQALETLKMMKRLEAKRSKSMKAWRIDGNTVVYATEKRFKAIAPELGVKLK